MIQLIIWLATFLCANPAQISSENKRDNLIQTTSTGIVDTGGETGGTPKPPPPPQVP